MKNKLTVAILAGGASSESKVSKISGTSVAKALKNSGFRVLVFDPKNEISKFLAAKNSIDVVFPTLHGRGGEDGEIQKLLTKIKIPFVGSGVRGMQNSFDKIRAKKIYRQNNLPVAREQIFRQNSKTKLKITFPIFVKPAREGSSFGASLVRNESEFASALKKAWKFGDALVEEFLAGIEISVGVLENPNGKLRALPPIEICPKNHFFDFAAKYDPQFCEEICPARIPKKVEKLAQKFAISAHEKLKLRHLSRTDMIVVGPKIYLLETNTLPGFTPNSLFPKEAVAAGIDFPKLCARLIALPLCRKK
ncbi:MAG: D-alanine--D-alanine ligase [Patescibacteria group bacterium]